MIETHQLPFQAVIIASLPLSRKPRQAVTLVFKHGAVSTIKAAVSPLVIPADGHRQPGRPDKTIHTLYTIIHKQLSVPGNMQNDGMIIILLKELLVFLLFFIH